MKLLALDTSSVTGFVLYDTQLKTVLKHGLVDVSAHLRTDFGAMGNSFHDHLSDLFTELNPDAMAIEKPFMRGDTTYHLFGLCFIAHMVAQRRGLSRYEVTPQQAKKRLIGSIRATKEEMLEAAEVHGYYFGTDHEADALAVALYTADTLLT